MASDDLQIGRTRTSSAWTLAALGLAIVLLMLVFILQNNRKVEMEFLWMDFTLPVGAAMLLSAVIGGLIVVLLGVARLAQVRLAARRHRKSDHSVTGPATTSVDTPVEESLDIRS